MESKFGFGAIPSKKDIRDYKVAAKALTNCKVPDSLLLNTVPIKNQGTKPTCAAHTLCELIEYHNKEQEGTFTKFSTDFIYGLRFDGEYLGNGMYIRDGLKKVQEYGDVDYNTLPGNSDVDEARDKVLSQLDKIKDKAYPNRISTYYRINNVNELKYALANDGPVVVGMWWYEDATLDKSNGKYIYTSANYRRDTGKKDGHAVLVVGYDDTGFIIQNSWGLTWGKNGLFWVRYDQFDLFFDVFGVTDDITSIKEPSEFKKFISPIINCTLRFFYKLFKK